MATDLIEIDPEHPGPRAIERAAAAVRRGEVVAIPTDALYTLVADPLNLHAVGRVFAAKGREKERSLPLLVSDIVMAEEVGLAPPESTFGYGAPGRTKPQRREKKKRQKKHHK